ncbi:MAG: epoxyqueuosine reductase QueH [candidate division Zixibacteria bacterium]|nr:epoxyqueuosine reductase QueH [candidate division Zixibacteria bacterium]
MKLAVHFCCGPCAVYPLEQWEKQGHEIVGYWYNPNIHPYTEYIKRLDSLMKLSNLKDLNVNYNDSYDLDLFLSEVAGAPTEPERCIKCYALRLRQTARYAANEGCDAFTTTLTLSPYQKHEVIKEIGKKMGDENHIEFVYQDYRQGYRGGYNRARDMGLYMQQYCGCIYSERDRFMEMNREKIIKKF